MELKDTVGGMLSDDYSERLIAERDQLEIRLRKLEDMLERWRGGNLGFELTCSFGLLDMQRQAMGLYLSILEERIRIEVSR